METELQKREQYVKLNTNYANLDLEKKENGDINHNNYHSDDSEGIPIIVVVVVVFVCSCYFMKNELINRKNFSSRRR